MTKYAALLLLIAFVAVPPCPGQKTTEQAAPAVADHANLDSYIQVLRSDLRAQKMEIVAAAMQFQDAESKVFWPIYRNYEMDLSKLNDQKVALLRDYVQHIDAISAAKAKELAEKSFDLERQRTELQRKYFHEMEKVMPANRVAKFFQVDHRLDLLINVQIASEVPLIE